MDDIMSQAKDDLHLEVFKHAEFRFHSHFMMQWTISEMIWQE